MKQGLKLLNPNTVYVVTGHGKKGSVEFAGAFKNSSRAALFCDDKNHESRLKDWKTIYTYHGVIVKDADL
jgi:hypothetical protein